MKSLSNVLMVLLVLVALPVGVFFLLRKQQSATATNNAAAQIQANLAAQQAALNTRPANGPGDFNVNNAINQGVNLFSNIFANLTA